MRVFVWSDAPLIVFCVMVPCRAMTAERPSWPFHHARFSCRAPRTRGRRAPPLPPLPARAALGGPLLAGGPRASHASCGCPL
ncbi:MAG: hypothetical protein J3K34DRAFT_431848 [Monoraphidium minutum]|nr:MAG: hypothetical protein J3K34DRAFT_431848 [Monoraphidium minutum]